MTDASSTVGTEVVNGAAGTPNQQVSPQAQTPIENDVTKLLSVFEGKFETLSKELRGLQSKQDKAESNFSQQLARLEQYEKQGLGRTEALAKMAEDDAQVSWRTKLETQLNEIAARLESGGTQTNRQQGVAQVFESLGLDPKDPRVAGALVRQYKNADEVELAAYRLQREIANTPNPTAAQQASMTGSTTHVDVNALAAEHSVLMKNPTKNMARLAEINKLLDEAG